MLNLSIQMRIFLYLCLYASKPFFLSLQDFDKEPIPLKPKGKKPKFIKPADKHNANEGQYGVFQQDLTLKQG